MPPIPQHGGGAANITPHASRGTQHMPLGNDNTPESVVQMRRKLCRLEGEQKEARHRGDVDKAVQRQGEIEEVLFDLKRSDKLRMRARNQSGL